MQETYRLSDPSAVKSLLARHGFTFSKSLGQNFLINPSVCPRMAEECGAGPGVGVLEVGPGIGVLTVELAKRAEKVVSIELDKRLLPVLHETLENHPNTKVVNDDVLKVDLQRLLQEEFAGMDVVVCANLPYYITSPVIMRLLEERLLEALRARLGDGEVVHTIFSSAQRDGRLEVTLQAECTEEIGRFVPLESITEENEAEP